MFIKWNDSYNTGIDSIDKEHITIFSEYEKLYNLMKIGSGYEEFYKSVDFLEHYVNSHFDNEEKLQNKIKYEYYEEHKKIHDEFRKVLKKFIISLRGKKIEARDLLQLNQFFKRFSNHICIEDTKLGGFIRSLD